MGAVAGCGPHASGLRHCGKPFDHFQVGYQGLGQQAVGAVA